MDLFRLFGNPCSGYPVLAALSRTGDVQCRDRPFLYRRTDALARQPLWRRRGGASGRFRLPAQYITAGRVSGMNTYEIVRYVQLPILFRQLLPTLMILQVGILHMSLFASLISVEEIFRVAQRINSIIYRPIEIYTALALFFLGVCLPINLLAAWLKKSFTRDYSER